MEMKKLLDISSRQGEFFPEAAGAYEADMVICRCAYGEIRDTCWDASAPAVKKAGIELGAYGTLTAHYDDKAENLAEAMIVMRRQVEMWISLCQEQRCSLLAISQKLERGHKMALGRAANTRLLQEAVTMIRAAGITPLVHASANWLISFVDWQAVNADWWVAHYQHNGVDCAQYCNTNSPAFPGFEAGKLLRSMYDNYRLFAWQYGRGGRMGERFGASSSYINRSLMYKNPKDAPRFASDMLLVKPFSGGDMHTVFDMANDLNIRCKEVDGALVVGPMSKGDLTRVTQQVTRIGLPCEDYFPPIELSPALEEKKSSTDQPDLMGLLTKIETILTRQDEQLASIDETTCSLMDMYISAANAMLG